MSGLFKKIGCLVLCLCLASLFWGCKVETVEQHEQGASSSVSQQESSSRAASGEGMGKPSQAAGSGEGTSSKASQAGESREEDPAGASGAAQESQKAPAVSAGESKAPGGTPSQPETPSAAQASSVPPEPEPEPETITVTISVLCDLAVGNPSLNPGVSVPADGVMVSGLSLSLTPGQTAYDALKQTGLALDYSGSPSRKNVYLRGIGGLYEKDCGPASGWVFSLNGGYPNTSCSNVTLNDGDVVVFQFTDGTKLY